MSDDLTITTSKFYADIPAGTEGVLINDWKAKGKHWYKLRLGKTKDGSPIEQVFPEDVIKCGKPCKGYDTLCDDCYSEFKEWEKRRKKEKPKNRT